eukprot:TRINITY_DN7678_c0_g1_i2.p1 TRINITY_DN7678_c0_g1~~TRINITY_DN7678_c0_g1_i2.p1  ORF type:complete len:759 (+),score=135.48 TRINITY_DN7678_c0_g1_i2:52-2328(+)
MVKPHRYWHNPQNQQNFLKSLAKRKGIRQWRDWYHIRNEDFFRNGGTGLLAYYNNSASKAIMAIYPQYNWSIEQFDNVKKYWQDPSNQRQFMAKIAKKLNIRSMEDWKSVTHEDIIRFGGSGLLRYFGENRTRLLQRIFPEHSWEEKKRHPSGYWKDVSNQRAFIESFAKERGISTLESWSKVSANDLERYGGGSLLYRFGGSLRKLLASLYPDHDWRHENLPKIKQLPSGYWHRQENRLRFLENFAKSRGFLSKEDWYSVTSQDFKNSGGGSLLNRYGGSVREMLLTDFPNHKWEFWRFSGTPSNFWDLRKNQQQFFKSLAASNNIVRISDWRRVSKALITKMGGGGLLRKLNGNVSAAIINSRPELTSVLTVANVSTPQKIMKRILDKIIDVPFMTNFRHPKLLHDTGKRMELDFWVPEWNLALEYQGEQHYRQLWEKSANIVGQQKRDIEKKTACSLVGIDLVVIPFWWDRTEEAIIASIRKLRPDLLSRFQGVVSDELAVPEVMPEKHNIEQSLMHGINYNKDANPTDWWMVEKFDGIRGCWNGREFFTRRGQLIAAPQDFKSRMPKCEVDGEFWIGESSFFEVSKTLKSGDWKDVTYQMFDLRGDTYRDLEFERRIEILKELSAKDDSNIKIANYTKCLNHKHLIESLIDVMNRGGEGIILRMPKSTYQTGRTSLVQKVKPQFLSVGTVKRPQNLQKTMQVKSSLGDDFNFYHRISYARFANAIREGTKLEFKFNALSLHGTPRTVGLHSVIK